MKSRTRLTLVIAGIALLARLLLFMMMQPWQPNVRDRVILRDDAAGYHKLATTILGTSRFAYDEESPPNDLRTPLYPLFISGVYAAAGQKPWLVLLVQIALDTATCLLVLSFAESVAGERAGPWAAAFYALDPHVISHCCTMLSDTLFVFLLVLGARFLIPRGPRHDIRETKWPAVAAVSGIWGLAALTRPIAQFLPAVLIPFWFVIAGYRRGAIFSVVSIAVFAGAISPWLARNQVLFGHPGLSTSGDYNLIALYTVPMALAREGGSATQTRENLFQEAESRMVDDGIDPETLNGFEKGRYYRAVALEHFAESPGLFVATYMKGLVHTMLNLGTSQYARQLGLPEGRINIKAIEGFGRLTKEFFAQKGPASIGIGILVALFLVLSYSCLVVGALSAWRSRNRELALLAAAMVLYFLALTGSGGLARFKLPMIPFYAPFCGAGVARLWSRFSRFTRSSREGPDSRREGETGV